MRRLDAQILHELHIRYAAAPSSHPIQATRCSARSRCYSYPNFLSPRYRPAEISERTSSPSVSTSQHAKRSTGHARAQIERSADRTRSCCLWRRSLKIAPVARLASPAKPAPSSCSPLVSPETGRRRRLCSAKIYLASWRLSADTGANERRSKVIDRRFYDTFGRRGLAGIWRAQAEIGRASCRERV